MFMVGLLAQIGVMISPLSEYLGINITAAASMFSFLTGATFAGTFISMLLYNRFPTQQVFDETILRSTLYFLNLRLLFFIYLCEGFEKLYKKSDNLDHRILSDCMDLSNAP